MADYTLQEKINIIKNSASLGDLPVDAMPFTQSNEYYFVSYSHADYKEVYCDILRLQEQGINLWYDRGLPAGRDWEKTAYEAIIKYSCIGVIFYLSKNSLLSDAVSKEIDFVKNNGKDYMSINLPLEGEGVSSARAMLEKLDKEYKIDYQKIGVVNAAFGDKVIYLDYDAPAEFKADKIKLMRRPDLLSFEIVDVDKRDFAENTNRKYDVLEDANRKYVSHERYAKLMRVNNIDITEITIPDRVEIDGQQLRLREVGECAFANCQYLQKVDFPVLSSIHIDKRAFYGCRSLKSVNLLSIESIGELAFANCDALEEVAITGKIAKNAFLGCKNLKKVYVDSYLSSIGAGNLISGQIEEIDAKDALDFSYDRGIFSYYSSFGWNNTSIAICGNAINGEITMIEYIKEIQEEAFANYQDLQKLNLYSPLSKIGEKAFYKCKNLKEVNFLKKEKLYTAKSLDFGDSSFAYCTAIKNIIVPKQTERIGKMAFLCCKNLSELTFEENSKLKLIDRQAFDRCSSIKSLILPDSLESIGINAFAECSNLEEIVISQNSSLKEIHAEAFAFCKKLSKLTLPESVESISKRAFYGCSKLNNIFYRGTIEQFAKINITVETEGKKIISFLDADTPEEKIRVICLNGETYIDKNEGLSDRIQDTLGDSSKKFRPI